MYKYYAILKRAGNYGRITKSSLSLYNHGSPGRIDNHFVYEARRKMSIILWYIGMIFIGAE